MPLTELDRVRLRQALQLAEGAVGLSDPNPRVGCVIGLADGTVLGRGHTQRAGEAHAEVMALRDAQAAGGDTRGATAWVTLEPCSHQGRTPPCCEALVTAGIARVVSAVEDPNPRVAGSGLARLRAAGIETVAADAELATAGRDLNVGFFSRMTRGRPWVRMKAAASLDGVTALHNGISQWITGDAARADGHAWRRRAGAVLSGIGTVLADDPRLDVRAVATVLQPRRIVVDSQLRTPSDARLLRPPGAATLVAGRPAPADQTRLESAGAQVLLLPGPDGRVDLASLMALLGQEGINELHVEAGPTLNGSLLQLGLVDEVLLYLAPTLLGIGGRSITALGPLASLDDRVNLHLTETVVIGTDLRIRAQVLHRAPS